MISNSSSESNEDLTEASDGILFMEKDIIHNDDKI